MQLVSQVRASTLSLLTTDVHLKNTGGTVAMRNTYTDTRNKLRDLSYVTVKPASHIHLLDGFTLMMRRLRSAWSLTGCYTAV